MSSKEEGNSFSRKRKASVKGLPAAVYGPCPELGPHRLRSLFTPCLASFPPLGI
jgi:hypothetical protein